jgi:hypothetical protein
MRSDSADNRTGRTAARICASTELQHWPRPHAAGVHSHAYGIRAVAPSTARMLARACISNMLASSILPPTMSASALSRGVARQSIAVHVAIRRRAMQCTRGLPHATCDRRHSACNRRARPQSLALSADSHGGTRGGCGRPSACARLQRRLRDRSVGVHAVNRCCSYVRTNARHYATEQETSAACDPAAPCARGSSGV